MAMMPGTTNRPPATIPPSVLDYMADPELTPELADRIISNIERIGLLIQELAARSMADPLFAAVLMELVHAGSRKKRRRKKPAELVEGGDISIRG